MHVFGNEFRAQAENTLTISGFAGYSIVDIFRHNDFEMPPQTGHPRAWEVER